MAANGRKNESECGENNEAEADAIRFPLPTAFP
jgi:hypothetical protein